MKTVTLPVGFYKEGARYREVVVDEMCGVDEENMSEASAAKNSSVAVTRLLQRAIQEIVGHTPAKTNPMVMLPEGLIRSMTLADRDTLLIAVRSASDPDPIKLNSKCPKCEGENEDLVDPDSIEIREWDDGEPKVEFELPRGHIDAAGKAHKLGVLRLPTGKDQEKIIPFIRSSQGKGMTMMLTSLMEQLGELKVVDSTIISRLSTKDRKYLMDKIASSMPGPRLSKQVVCGHCQHEYDTPIGTAHFFGG